jgi:hypothetical protein
MDSIFDSKNELKANFIKWGKIGDYIVGTLVRVFSMPDSYAKVPGTMKNVYEIKASEGFFNNIENKKLTGETTTINVGDLYCVDGNGAFRAQMESIKVGQIIGVKFIEERPAKDPKNFDAKITKVYAPKGPDGVKPLMDEEWLKESASVEGMPSLNN